MTKRETWLFAVGGTAIATIVFLALTVDSHRQFPELTNSDQLSEKVKAGEKVWHENNCINCHTLLGEGAYFAPDLTKITKQRGKPYLTQFLKDPSKFYNRDEHIRVMPDPELTDEEIDQVIAFLDWVSEIDTHGWPPRPIRVTGPALTRGQSEPEKTTPEGQDPVAKGRQLFHDDNIACVSCHDTSTGGESFAPALAGLAERAKDLIDEDKYTGDAEDARGYVRESILEPNAHIIEGENLAQNGTSLMPGDYDKRLSDEQLSAIVDYLMTLE